MSRATVMKSKVYQEIKDCSSKLLAQDGYVEWKKVLKDTGFKEVGDIINWNFIRDAIEEEYNTELIPLGEAFFARHSKEDEIMNPGKYLAGGNNGSTVGYAIGNIKNAHLLKQYLDHKCDTVKGLVTSVNESLRVGRGAGVFDTPGSQMMLQFDTEKHRSN